MYISESRLTGNAGGEEKIIEPGSKTICQAIATIVTQGAEGQVEREEQVITKLDSCGSVSIAHSDYLVRVQPAKSYGLRNIRLLGIGGKTNYLTKVGVLQVKTGDAGVCYMLCYTFDAPLGDIEKIILLGLHTVVKANINILQHMKNSLEGKCTPLTFWPQGRSFDEALRDLSAEDEVKRIFKLRKPIDPREVYLSTEEYDEVTGEDLVNLTINHIETGGSVIEEAYMTEIQLRRIVDRTNQAEGKQLSDGDELMIKNGVSISKFSKEAMGLGKDCYDEEGASPMILKKIYILYDRYVGKDSVFPVSNGAPRIMTKYRDTPYTYELQPEYAKGERKFACVKAMDWTGKTATAQVIRGFISGSVCWTRMGTISGTVREISKP